MPPHPIYESASGCGGVGRLTGLWSVVSTKGESWEDSGDLTLRHSLGLLLVPPISQTQPGARIQGIPGRGPLGLLFFFLI